MTPVALALRSLRCIDLAPFVGYAGVDRPLAVAGLFLVATAMNLAVGGVALFAWRRLDPQGEAWRPVDLYRVLLAAIGVLGSLGVQMVVLHFAGVSGFGLISLVWYALVLVMPMLAIACLWQRRMGRPVTRPACRLAILALLAQLVAIDARCVEPFRLTVEQVNVVTSALPEAAPVRVAVLADLQTDRIGAYEHAVVDRLLALHPDVIVLPGDLFHGSPAAWQRQREPLRQLLARLHAPGGVFFARGDVDLAAELPAVFAGTEVRWLENEVARVAVNGRAVTIVGLARELGAAAERLLHEVDAAAGDDLRLAVAHYPRAVMLLPPTGRIAAVMTGHTHGGQVNVPGFGPPITLERVPRKIAAGGLHEWNGRRVYVSRGVGLERALAPRIRFNCPPEVSLLTFR